MAGDIIKSQTYEAMTPLLLVAAIYLVIVMFMTWGCASLKGGSASSDHR